MADQMEPKAMLNIDRMFLFYITANRNQSATAREFKLDRNAIRRYIKKYDWEKKADKIDQAKTNAVVKKAVSDIEMIGTVQVMVVDQIVERLKNPKTDLKVSISDLALLTRLKLEIKGEIPAEGDSKPVNLTVNVDTGTNNDSGNEHYGRIASIYTKASNNPRFDPINN